MMIAAAVMVAPATAQDLALNYERFSSVEQPFAMTVGEVTLLLNGVLDLPVIVGRDHFTANTATPCQPHAASGIDGKGVP